MMDSSTFAEKDKIRNNILSFKIDDGRPKSELKNNPFFRSKQNYSAIRKNY